MLEMEHFQRASKSRTRTIKGKQVESKVLEVGARKKNLMTLSKSSSSK